MERLLFIMRLHEGAVAEYEKRHESVWPALLEDIWNAGMRNYSLFRRDLNVYAYAECHPDRKTTLEKLSESKANRDWSEYFSDVIAVLNDEDGNLIEAHE